jgi:hypothetical protein
MDLSPSDAETESSSSKELILLRRDVIELSLMLDIQFLFGMSWAILDPAGSCCCTREGPEDF